MGAETQNMPCSYVGIERPQRRTAFEEVEAAGALG